VIVTGKTAEIAKQNGLSVKAFLAENDSYHFFEKVGGLIKTGPTGTNVNDLVFLIAF
jgi:hydroxypyruvate reductase